MAAPAPGADNAPDGAGGYVIEIYVKADGTFEVSREDKEEPDPAGGEEPGAGPDQSADNIGDALKAAYDIFEKAGGKNADDDFAAGFGPKSGAMPVGKGMM